MIKYTDEALIRQNTKIAKVKEYMDSMRELTSPDRAVFWKGLRRILNQVIEENDNKLHQVLLADSEKDAATTLADLKLLQGSITISRELIKQVEEVDDLTGRAAAKVIELEAQRNAMRDNIELQDGGHNG